MGIMQYITGQEKFVTDDEAKNITASNFIVIGSMVGTTLLSIFLFWAYTLETRIFAAILWTLVFLYTIINIGFTAASRDKLKPFAFRFLISLHSVMCLVSMGLLIFYYIKGINAYRSYTSSRISGYSDSSRYSTGSSYSGVIPH
jgi:hypothetical protein